MKQKENLSIQSNEPTQLPAGFEELRKGAGGFKVPEGYFDSLSSRIVDEIKEQEQTSVPKIVLAKFRKPWVWAPSLVTVVVAVLLIFVVPAKQNTAIPVSDEWAEINLAYDASYAEEAVLADGHALDKELEIKNLNFMDPETSGGINEATTEEIARYLKEREYETNLLTEY